MISPSKARAHTDAPGAPAEDPGVPLLVIEASGRRGGLLRLDEIWRYRELLFFLTWRDLKARYKQTALGAAWAILQPLLSMLVYTLFFGKLAKIPSDGIPYPIFVYAAMLPWIFFSSSIGRSGNSVLGSSNLICKVYFPRLIIPVAAILPAVADYAVGYSALVGLLLWHHIWPSALALVVLPALSLQMLLLALGVALWLNTLNVRFRDINQLVPFAIQLWMIATPIVYPLSLIPERYRWLAILNPLTGIIEGIRSVLFGTPWHPTALAASSAITALVLFTGLVQFNRREKTFADIV